ncbi:hypothetical protein RND71_040309 [Anisodus tanguticus]|uniref:RBR-type E3 ubiquitin transferase n=1 Tax=Anisodus tanguticus TaxID=243964 RepID=A0AAE1QVC3_9SOLA|nr:hypothetical protein RND71_040309 [Anisodus tanguticus]
MAHDTRVMIDDDIIATHLVSDEIRWVYGPHESTMGHITTIAAMCVYQSNYSVLSEADIHKHQEESISKTSTVLSIPRVAAGILLCHYDWSVSKVNDEWFADEEKVRRIVGWSLLVGSALKCTLVMTLVPLLVAILFAAHVGKGILVQPSMMAPGCLMLRCPDPSCSAAVGSDMIHILASNDDKVKYNRYFLRSFVEDNRKTKWCPAPGCDYAVEFIVGGGSYDVTCRCLYSFCWSCAEEAHRPVDCVTVAKLCLGPWSDHGERTGGFYACNLYETAKQEGVFDESEKRREMAKNSSEKYIHYYERWATNQSLEKLSDKQCQPESQLKFIIDVWLQVRLNLDLNGFHQCAEKELQVYLDADGLLKDFNEFRTKLAGLTRSVILVVVGNNSGLTFIGNPSARILAETKESGPSFRKWPLGYGFSWCMQQNSKLENLGGGSGKVKGSRGKGTASRSVSSRNMDDSGHWSCEYCTYANARSANVCQMCQQHR